MKNSDFSDDFPEFDVTIYDVPPKKVVVFHNGKIYIADLFRITILGLWIASVEFEKGVLFVPHSTAGDLISGGISTVKSLFGFAIWIKKNKDQLTVEAFEKFKTTLITYGVDKKFF